MRWFGHVQRRHAEYIGRKMLRMELAGKRKTGRLKRRFTEVLRGDMQVLGVKEEGAKDRRGSRQVIPGGDP